LGSNNHGKWNYLYPIQVDENEISGEHAALLHTGKVLLCWIAQILLSGSFKRINPQFNLLPTLKWQKTNTSMTSQRWYPTCVTLGDERGTRHIIIVSPSVQITKLSYTFKPKPEAYVQKKSFLISEINCYY
jgi:hypothetical protein